jgi:hypothetical protein
MWTLQSSRHVNKGESMNIRKPLLIAGALTTIGAAGLAGNSMILAESGTSGAESLVSKIAQKFNLKTEDVQAVFDEEKSTHEAERQAKMEEKLNQAVTDGKLTAEQKDKIIAKHKELQTQMEADREAMKDKTHDERHAAMEAKRTELEQWAKDNNIPLEYLHVIHKHGGPGRGGHGMRLEKDM